MFALATTPLDPAALTRALADPRAGACATFEGWVRNHHAGRTVQALEYEAYAALAEKEGARILAEAREKYALLAAAAVHRVGLLYPGDLAVWVGATSAHRDDAFAGCRYLIDEIKLRVPIWKREHYPDAPAVWINATAQVGPPGK